MSTPQQPELARSKRSAAAADSAKAHIDPRPESGAPMGPIPEDNQPGHHPDVEQDKPQHSPKLPPPNQRFSFRFQAPLSLAGLAFGVTPRRSYVALENGHLEVRFGLWSLRTPIDNIVDASITGPYRWWKVIGPPRLSLADGGVTFATTSEAGVCLQFRDPVPAALPGGLLKHPAATVTVAEPDQLVAALTSTR